jgi:chemotaxis protein CheX
MPFEIISQNEYLLMKLKGECNGDEKPSALDAFTEALKQTQLKYLIVNCSECGALGPAFLRHLSQIFRELKTVNGAMRLVGAPDHLNDIVKRNGLDRILINRMSLRGALVDFGLVKTKEFDVNFINPFLNATTKVFKIQCFTECKPQKPSLKKPGDPLLLGDISGIISISSETFNGTLAISLSEKVFVNVASKMLGEEIKAIDESNVDLVGELANIILGQAKIELAQLGYGIQMALPSCVWGKDHKIKHFGGGVCVVIPMETEYGVFYSEVMTTSVATATGGTVLSKAS